MDINEILQKVSAAFGDAYVEETRSLYYNFGTVAPGGSVFSFFNYQHDGANGPFIKGYPIEALMFNCSCWKEGRLIEKANSTQIMVELDLTSVGAPARKEDLAQHESTFNVTRSFRIDFLDPQQQPDYLVSDSKIKYWNNEKVALWATVEGTIQY